jgi:hypothetical protein
MHGDLPGFLRPEDDIRHQGSYPPSGGSADQVFEAWLDRRATSSRFLVWTDGNSLYRGEVTFATRVRGEILVAAGGAIPAPWERDATRFRDWLGTRGITSVVVHCNMDDPTPADLEAERERRRGKASGPGRRPVDQDKLPAHLRDHPAFRR